MVDLLPTNVMEITQDENNVLWAAKQIRFGDLLDVELSDGPKKVVGLTARQKAFIDLVRDEGLSLINKITVHASEPIAIEIGGVAHGIKFIRKLRP